MMKLNPAQQGIWAGHLLSEDKALYNTAECVVFSGRIDSELLTKSIQLVVLECDALSCYYRSDDSLNGYIVGEKSPVLIERQVLPDDVSMNDYVRSWAEASDLQRPFDLANELPCRFKIFHGPKQDALYLCVHHIALDGYGYLLFLQRLAEVYTAMEKGIDPPAANFASLSETIEVHESGHSDFETSRIFWRERLSDLEEPAALMTIDGALRPGYHRVKAEMSTNAWRNLQDLAKTSKSNWTELLTAAFALLLFAKTGTTKPVLGVPMMNRMGSKAARVPCMNMNLVPVVFSLSADDTLISIAKKIAQEKKILRPHQTYRYEDMQRDQQKLNRKQRLFGPVVNVLPFNRDLVFGSFTGKKDIISAGPVVDATLTILMAPSTEKPSIELSCNKTAGTQHALELLKDDFFLLLDCALQSADKPVDEIVKESKAKACEQALLGGSSSSLDRKHVLARIRSAVAASPKKSAIITIDQSISYADLMLRVEEWSGSLKKHGVQPGDYVGVMLERSVDAVVAMLAILNAGATYVPLDRHQPEKRQAFILSTLGLKFLIVEDEDKVSQLSHLRSMKLMRPSLLDGGARFSYSAGDVLQAYVMFTSGSTGRPKGVVVSMEALSAFVTAAMERYKITSDDTVLQFAPFHFDTSIEEIFLALASGSTLALRTNSMLESFREFVDQSEAFGCSVLDLPTAYWNEWVEALATGAARLPKGVKTLILGGEAVQPAKLKKWFKVADASIDLVNSYGPTEATVVVSTTKLTPLHVEADHISIGTPISGVQFLVLDQSGWPADKGELLIAGKTLGSHYLGTEKGLLSAVAIGEGSQNFYRTGDLVLRRDDEIFFLGRKDNEIKISGQRIQPQEVESQLLTMSGVKEASVIGVKHDGRSRIIAFVVLIEGTDSDTVRAQIVETLPPTMRPLLKVVAALPKNSAGKVDRLALLANPMVAALPTRLEELINPSLLARVKHVWRSELAVEDIDESDSFFYIGGQSLQAIQLAWRLSREFACEVHVADIFQYPVLADFGRFLAEKIASEKASTQIFRLTYLPSFADKKIFAIPGIFGSSAQFLDLAFQLRAKAKIGVVELGLGGETLLRETAKLPELALSYARFIAEQREDGEIIVLGHSFGGILALEVSEILRKQAFNVRCVLLDSYIRPSATSLRFDEVMKNMKASLGAKDDRYLEDPGNIRVAEQQWALLAAHEPQHPHSVPTLRFYAKNSGRLTGVREVCNFDPGDFESLPNSYEVDGNHYTMLTGPGAVAIGKRFSEWI